MRNLLILFYNFLVLTCRIPILGGVSIGKNCQMKGCDVHSIHGKSNQILIKDGSTLLKCSFIINGNNNKIVIGNRCKMSNTTFWIKGNNNIIDIGDGTTVGIGTQFAALEGTSVVVGKDCMFSHDILVRTSDSHSIVDIDGKRINFSKNIIIGNHCWVGLQALILKGSVIPDNSVVAARATINKQFETAGCIMAGAPAKVVKQGINWDRRQL